MQLNLLSRVMASRDGAVAAGADVHEQTHPYGPNAGSTQALANGAARSSAILRVTGPIGHFVGPAAEGLEAYLNTPAHATGVDKTTAAIMGTLRGADDAILSGGLGVLAGLVTSPSTVGAVAAAAVTSSAVSIAYDNSLPDAWVDRQINRLEPAVRWAVEKASPSDQRPAVVTEPILAP